MTPARRNKLEAALAVIADVNDADAWGTLTAETHRELVKLGAIIGETEVLTNDEGLAHFMELEGITALCAFDNGEHLLLRWAANARTYLAEGEEEPIPTSGYAEIRDLPTEEQA